MTVDEHELLEAPEDFGEPEELDETSAEFVDQLVKRIIIFTEEFCDVEFFPYQIPIAYRIIESTVLGDGDLMTVVATRQCLDGDTVVFRRDGSACRIRNHEDAWSTGVKPTKEYRVHGGGNIIATDNHPFWTPSGWKMAGELQTGDLVAVMDGWTREAALKLVPDTEARFLGYMVTDGSMRPYQSYKFTNINKKMLDEVAKIAESYGVPAKWYEKGKGFDLLFTTKRGTSNPIRDLLNSYTWDHGFPTDVFSWDKKSVGEFVNRAWSGDGCLSPRISHGKMTPDVFMACGNDNIYAQYWRSLLLMHGVHSTIKQEAMPKGTGVFNRLVLSSSAHNLAKFFDLIGGPVFAKEEKSQEILDIVNSLKNSYYTTTSTEGKYSSCENGMDGESFRFAPIISITDKGEREVFDVCYPDKGWFVGNGFKVHNSGKSEVLSACIAGMMVILPKLAPIYPTWLSKFEKGFWVGTFAPTEEQADTVFGRIVSKLTSDHALEFLLDPEIDDKATGGGTRGRGRLITLKNSGSLCRMQTCNPKAKIESKTYHMVLVDEAQEADEVMITKSIAPMLAFNNGTMVLTGTANRYKSYFYKMIQYNKRRAANGGRKFRNAHFEYDYRIASKYNPNYAKFISKEKLRIGEDSDEFQMSYCVAPETKILTADLRHIPAKNISVGMKLVGFDEERDHKGAHRQFKESEVLGVSTVMRPSYRLTLTDGTSVVCSAEHQWLVLTAGRRTEWKTTESLAPTDQIMRMTHVWDTVGTHSSGYLAGAFDGEGHLARTPVGQITNISFAQKDNPMMSEVRKFMTELGYEYSEYSYEGNNGVIHMHLRGGKQTVMKFLGSIRPQRLLNNFKVNDLGSIGRHDKKTEKFVHPFVASLEFLGERKVVAIKTSTATYVAEGLASHNCNKFILEKGMFVTEERLDRMYDQSMPLVKEWWRTPIVAGIDVARSNDSTVVTAVWVDWDHPDPFGFYEHRILNWLEINNEEWESQYFHIVDFLRHYDVLRVGVDSQGVGGAVAERLALLLPGMEVLPVSSDSKAQNERWVHLTELIQRDQLIIPGHSKARRTRTWKRFNQQMSDLEKVYKGPYLLAAAPDEKGAFDDYPDSLAIACYMTIQDTMPQVQESISPFMR